MFTTVDGRHVRVASTSGQHAGLTRTLVVRVVAGCGAAGASGRDGTRLEGELR